MNKQAGIYIHVPFCAKKCPYCDFYSERYTVAQAARYTDAVCRNIAALPEELACDTVYFGGGTPSLLSGLYLKRMMDGIHARCQLTEDAEITLEANPLTVTNDKLQQWKEAGINRLSLGVQSFQQTVLTLLGRSHTPAQCKEAILRAHAAGFENLSLDLMIGTALHTAALLDADLDAVLSLPVQHVSVYLLKIEASTPFGSHPPALLGDDEAADRYLQLHARMEKAGFSHYEISNFAKNGMESRHNCKYWQLAPYYGIGAAAHSCYGGKRYAVARDLRAFCEAPVQKQIVTEPCAETEAECIMLGLRMKHGIRVETLTNGKRLLENAKPLIPEYLRLEDGELRMTPAGWLVSNAVLGRLLRGID